MKAAPAVCAEAITPDTEIPMSKATKSVSTANLSECAFALEGVQRLPRILQEHGQLAGETRAKLTEAAQHLERVLQGAIQYAENHKPTAADRLRRWDDEPRANAEILFNEVAGSLFGRECYTITLGDCPIPLAAEMVERGGRKFLAVELSPNTAATLRARVRYYSDEATFEALEDADFWTVIEYTKLCRDAESEVRKQA